MKILHLSHTHNCHHRLRDLSDADVVVHSGDFCMVGTDKEAIDFLNWFCDLPYKHKILITFVLIIQTVEWNEEIAESHYAD